MASIAPRMNLGRIFFEPVRGTALLTSGLAVWFLGAAYCHGYQYLRSGITGSWSGSLTWSAIAVVPWFALFEWAKQPRGIAALHRPRALGALVLGIAAFSVALEYAVNFCVGDTTGHLGLLIMRRLPAIGVTVLLLALTRKAVLRRPPAHAPVELGGIAGSIDWIEAADNYVEVHLGSRVLLLRMTMRMAERELRSRGFLRIHRRFLVNRSRVQAVIGSNGDRRVRVAGKDLPVGSRYATDLRL